MAEDHIRKLSDLFMKFPGVGPRQARRFVYFLLWRGAPFAKELSKLITELSRSVSQCTTCFRFFVPRYENEKKGSCGICIDEGRDATLLLLVEKDADLENIECAGAYKGSYFVLGGLLPILAEEPEKKIRQHELLLLLKKKKELSEIILALSASPEGDYTGDYLKKILTKEFGKNPITLSTLGRGLSTGTELEYSDSHTLQNALKNRG